MCKCRGLFRRTIAWMISQAYKSGREFQIYNNKKQNNYNQKTNKQKMVEANPTTEQTTGTLIDVEQPVSGALEDVVMDDAVQHSDQPDSRDANLASAEEEKTDEVVEESTEAAAQVDSQM